MLDCSKISSLGILRQPICAVLLLGCLIAAQQYLLMPSADGASEGASTMACTANSPTLDLWSQLKEAPKVSERPVGFKVSSTLARDARGNGRIKRALARALRGGPPVSVVVLGNSYTKGIGCYYGMADAKRIANCTGTLYCYACAWPARFEAWAEEFYGPGIIKVVNQARSASSTGAISSLLAEFFSENILGGRGPDLILLDYSISDATKNIFASQRETVTEDKLGLTNLASVEHILRRLLCQRSRPAVWLMQGPKRQGFETYARLAQLYKLPFLELDPWLRRPKDDSLGHWPHPTHFMHVQQTELVASFWVWATCHGQFSVTDEPTDLDAFGETVSDGCSSLVTPPLSAPAERVWYEGCASILSYQRGADPALWRVVHADPGWRLSHADVPERPDKTGWLFQRSVADAAAASGSDARITFEVPLSHRTLITVGFLRTYENMGWAHCWIDDHQNIPSVVKLNGGWGKRVGVSLVQSRDIEPTRRQNPSWIKNEKVLRGYIPGWNIPEGVTEVHNFTCKAIPPRRKDRQREDYKFKIMFLTSC